MNIIKVLCTIFVDDGKVIVFCYISHIYEWLSNFFFLDNFLSCIIRRNSIYFWSFCLASSQHSIKSYMAFVLFLHKIMHMFMYLPHFFHTLRFFSTKLNNLDTITIYSYTLLLIIPVIYMS